MRKSPIVHAVHSYKKSTGRTVGSYRRGHGIKKVKLSNPHFTSLKNRILSNAKTKFGITNNPHESGFLLPDGSLLDSASTGKGQRFCDHNSVAKMLGTTVEQLKKIGVIRFVATSRSLNLEFNQNINKKQWNQIEKIINSDQMKEVIYADVFNNDGKLIASKTVFADRVFKGYEKPSTIDYLTTKQFEEKYVNA